MLYYLLALLSAPCWWDAGCGLVESPGAGLVFLGHAPGVHVVPAPLGSHLLRDDRVDPLLKGDIVLPGM